MKIIDFDKPNYLLCELPIKNGSGDDQRLWVYAVNHLSLIECISVDFFGEPMMSEGVIYRRYNYQGEEWILGYVQNNVEMTDGDEKEVMDKAWAFLTDYLKWEDDRLDFNENLN